MCITFFKHRKVYLKWLPWQHNIASPKKIYDKRVLGMYANVLILP